MTARSARRQRVVVSWSGGKDSALALHAVRQDPSLQIEALLTTITEGHERVSVHGVRRSLLEAQAAALNLPLVLAPIPIGASNEAYEAAQRAALAPLRARDVRAVVCGDLFLDDVRAYRDRLFASVGLHGRYPLWGLETRTLAERFLADGFRAVLVCVDPRRIDPDLCGREFDAALLAELPPTADPCGEHGEFHTFVYDGPIFRRPVPVARGELVDRDGFRFCDLSVRA